MLNTEGRNPLNNVDAEPTAGDICIRIKSANLPSCEDLEFHIKNEYTVMQIKETIQRLSVQHPEVKEQRIIYAGHLLDDNQILKEVLTAKFHVDLQQPVTIHLACTSKYLYSPGASNSLKTSTPKDNQSHLTGGALPQQQQLFNNQGFAVPQDMQGDTGIPPDVMTLHQAYVEQMTAYMNHWHMQQNAMMGMGGFFYQVPPAMGNYNNVVPPPAPVVAEPPPVPARPQENVVAARAADDEDNPRDLLDWMYTFSRVMLILSVVYFYSSFSRFILVVMFTGLVMILQRRNNNEHVPGAEAVANNANPMNPPAAAAAADRPEEPRLPEAGAANPNEEGRDDQANVPEEGAEVSVPVMERPPPPPQETYQQIAWTFMRTFFTSLIPETYQNN